MHKNKSTLLEQINLLPDELKDIIHSYLPICVIVFLNKTNYYLYHRTFIKNIISDRYIRFIVRKNIYFVLENLLKEYGKMWINKYKKYKYTNVLYSDYLQFLISYCIENQANDCKTIILLFLENLGMSKNQHKNNSTINIRWKH